MIYKKYKFIYNTKYNFYKLLILIEYMIKLTKNKMHQMIGKVYKSKKVWVIVRQGEDIKVVIATSNHIDSW